MSKKKKRLVNIFELLKDNIFELLVYIRAYLCAYKYVFTILDFY